MVSLIFYLTRCAIYKVKPSDFMEIYGKENIDWDEVFEVATENNLIPVIYSVILEIDKEHNILSDRQRQWININARRSLMPELQKFYMISEIGAREILRNVHELSA